MYGCRQCPSVSHDLLAPYNRLDARPPRDGLVVCRSLERTVFWDTWFSQKCSLIKPFILFLAPLTRPFPGCNCNCFVTMLCWLVTAEAIVRQAGEEKEQYRELTYVGRAASAIFDIIKKKRSSVPWHVFIPHLNHLNHPKQRLCPNTDIESTCSTPSSTNTLIS